MPDQHKEVFIITYLISTRARPEVFIGKIKFFNAKRTIEDGLVSRERSRRGEKAKEPYQKSSSSSMTESIG